MRTLKHEGNKAHRTMYGPWDLRNDMATSHQGFDFASCLPYWVV